MSTTIILLAYMYATGLFLLLQLVIKSLRALTVQFLDSSNLILLVVLSVTLFLTIRDTMQCENYYLNCSVTLYWSLIFGLSFHWIFLFKRFRTSKLLTLVSMAFVLLLLQRESVFIFFFSLFRDYLPSSWSIAQNYIHQLYTLLATVFYFAICYLSALKKRRRQRELP